MEIRGTPRSTRVYPGSRSCTCIALRAWGILACAGTPPGINSSCGAERRPPPTAGLLLLMPGGEQQQPAHARIPLSRGAMPVHEREPAYTHVERGVSRISFITNPNLYYNQISSTWLFLLGGSTVRSEKAFHRSGFPYFREDVLRRSTFPKHNF